MELFTFVKMNAGRSDAIIITLLDDTPELLRSLDRFDAGKSRCFLDIDRQKLLAVIEASFGTFAPFNRLVRGILADKLSGADKI